MMIEAGAKKPMSEIADMLEGLDVDDLRNLIDGMCGRHESDCWTSARVLGRLRDLSRSAMSTVGIHFVPEHYGHMANWSPTQIVNYFVGKFDHFNVSYCDF